MRPPLISANKLKTLIFSSHTGGDRLIAVTYHSQKIIMPLSSIISIIARKNLESNIFHAIYNISCSFVEYNYRVCDKQTGEGRIQHTARTAPLPNNHEGSGIPRHKPFPIDPRLSRRIISPVTTMKKQAYFKLISCQVYSILVADPREQT